MCLNIKCVKYIMIIIFLNAGFTDKIGDAQHVPGECCHSKVFILSLSGVIIDETWLLFFLRF